MSFTKNKDGRMYQSRHFSMYWLEDETFNKDDMDKLVRYAKELAQKNLVLARAKKVMQHDEMKELFSQNIEVEL